LDAVRHVDVVFVVDGNWAPWTGADIETKGLGGSETWAVEMATQMKRQYDHVVFFCNCVERSVYRGIEFLPIRFYEQFMATHDVTTCIVSRFSHYLFAPMHTSCKQVILYLHDLGPTGTMLPVNEKLTHVFCLSPWHAGLVRTNFPSHASRTTHLGYGIDTTMWKPAAQKVAHSFIYSSFPDRGLVHLLEMWPRILQIWPDATLRIFCNLQHEHVRRVQPAMMARIDALLSAALPGVVVEGWVSKKELAAAYGEAEYWLYPCIFDETFCLTALEALASGCVCIAPPKAALQHFPLEFVDFGGGDASSSDWQEHALWVLRSFHMVQLGDDVSVKNIALRGVQYAQERSWNRQSAQFTSSLIGFEQP
jgi:glycosyltransferase involved in cell wall biosynthesis